MGGYRYTSLSKAEMIMSEMVTCNDSIWEGNE